MYKVSFTLCIVTSFFFSEKISKESLYICKQREIYNQIYRHWSDYFTRKRKKKEIKPPARYKLDTQKLFVMLLIYIFISVS